MGGYEQSVAKIVEAIGGKENIVAPPIVSRVCVLR